MLSDWSILIRQKLVHFKNLIFKCNILGDFQTLWFWWVFENLMFAFKQCFQFNFSWTKIGGKCQNKKSLIWSFKEFSNNVWATKMLVWVRIATEKWMENVLQSQAGVINESWVLIQNAWSKSKPLYHSFDVSESVKKDPKPEKNVFTLFCHFTPFSF